MKNSYKKYLWMLAMLLALCLSTMAAISYVYSQQFVQTSPTTATKGILFKKTLKLEVYQNVSTGNDWLGTYDRYSRSLNHADVITVYCKDFCKNK